VVEKKGLAMKGNIKSSTKKWKTRLPTKKNKINQPTKKGQILKNPTKKLTTMVKY
jgi:hypothetical protein